MNKEFGERNNKAFKSNFPFESKASNQDEKSHEFQRVGLCDLDPLAVGNRGMLAVPSR